jgi:hypothetical protein
MAFGERHAFECCLLKMKSIKNEQNIKVLETVLKIYALETI